MDNAIYAALTRQAGLMREMRAVANNMANSSTTGFRREGVVFSEHMTALDRQRGTLSMANAQGREVDLTPAALSQTGGKLDLALEREGFFMVQTPQGNRLTRAGAFMMSPEGELVNADGYRVLDEGQAPIALPPGARSIGVGADGTISADGQPVGRVGVFDQPDRTLLRHEGGTLFSAEGAEAAPDAVVHGPHDPGGRLPGVLNVELPGCSSDALLLLLDAAGVDCSTGSACSAGVAQPSHVLLALGRTEVQARSALRFSLGHTSTRADVDALAHALPEVLSRARAAGHLTG